MLLDQRLSSGCLGTGLITPAGSSRPYSTAAGPFRLILWHGVTGREADSLSDDAYSPAFKNANIVWTETLTNG
jgi:hypothetical protein